MAGEPEIAPAAMNELVRDAYLAQHHGAQSAQSTQSVAVHLLVLFGVLRMGEAPSRSLWILTRASRPKLKYQKDRFVWLEPPPISVKVTLADVVAGTTPEDRRDKAERYIRDVWAGWSERHLEQLSKWYRE